MDFEHWRHCARGWLWHFFGREEAAFNEYVTACRLRPNDVRAARHAAFIAVKMKRHDVAETWLVEAVRLAPEDADSHFNLGFVREELGKARAAIASFGEATRLKPGLDRAWYGLGLAHARLGQHAEAATAFAKAAELQPMNGVAFYQWGMARHHANDPDGVRAVAERLVAFDPTRARKLMRDAGRTDLTSLIPELPY
jgi:tetratricopeptide (TPR) repeat protein